MNPEFSADSSGKVRLTGSVAGVESCALVTDQENFTVGAGLACDLCLVDPLLPGPAFRLRREWSDPANRGGWTVEALEGTRLYLNQELIHRDRIRLGDVLHAGCHRFRFELCSPGERNHRLNAPVGDLFSRLLKPPEMPAGFLQSRPSYQARRRFYRALAVGAGCLAVFALLFLTVPRPERFESIQPPLEIVMVSPKMASPRPDAVRSLKNVERRRVTEPTPPTAPPELKETPRPESQPTPEPAAKPMPSVPAPATRSPAAEAPKISLGQLTAAPITLTPPSRQEVRRTVSALAASAPAPRRTVAETRPGTRQAEPVAQPVTVETATNLFRPAPAAVVKTAPVDAAPPAPRTAAEGAAGAARVAALMQYQASPVTLESYAGSRIPVARLPGALSEVAVPGSDQAVVLDGVVSDAEIAMSWKSGQFRRHAPGHPPPLGDPPTYCYVGQATLEGKNHLYISFVCIDPDVRKIRADWNGAWGNPPRVTWDDSVEIFLDVNGDRNDYHQMIVNTRGQYWAAYYPNNRMDGDPQPWSGVQPRIKTQINAQAQRWTCEVMIPFDQLGGTPRKGQRWTVNFCRNFRGQYAPDSNLQNWFLVYKNEQYFLKPQLFGVFEW